MDDGKTRNRRVGTPVPGCPQIPSRREAHPHFLHQNNAQNAKTGSASQPFSRKGCASFSNNRTAKKLSDEMDRLMEAISPEARKQVETIDNLRADMTVLANEDYQ